VALGAGAKRGPTLHRVRPARSSFSSSIRPLRSAVGKAEIDGQAIFGNRPKVVVGVFHVEGTVAVIPHDLFICEGDDPLAAEMG